MRNVPIIVAASVILFLVAIGGWGLASYARARITANWVATAGRWTIQPAGDVLHTYRHNPTGRCFLVSRIGGVVETAAEVCAQ